MNPNVEDEEGFCDANASMAPSPHGQFPVPLLTSNIEIPFFSGKANEDFDKWFRDFKRIARANRWNDECSLEILPAYLRGKAADIYENLTVREISTLNELSQALSNRFNPRESQRLYYYYRRFIPEFANIASPLFKLLQKNHRFSWDVHCENAFHMLKKHLTNPPVMSYPDFEQPFEVQCDASDSGIASILSQNGRVISYASRTLQKHEKNYSTIGKECLAVIWSIKYFKYYLGGHKLTIYSDHQPLKWLLSMKNPVNNRLARWCMFLQEYDFTMSHIPGKLNYKRRPQS